MFIFCFFEIQTEDIPAVIRGAKTAIIQGLLNQKIPLRETVIMFYIFNESLSILENAAYFIPIPKKLKETLKQLKEHEDLLR